MKGLHYQKARVPAQPFRDWIEERIEYYERQRISHPVKRVAFDVGRSVRVLSRYRRGVKAGKPDGYKTPTVDIPTDTFELDRVEEMLDNAGVFLWELYGEEAA